MSKRDSLLDRLKKDEINFKSGKISKDTLRSRQKKIKHQLNNLPGTDERLPKKPTHNRNMGKIRKKKEKELFEEFFSGGLKRISKRLRR